MALGVDGGGMKIKIQITIESDAGNPAMPQEVAQLDRGTLRPETLGLTLVEARREPYSDLEPRWEDATVEHIPRLDIH